MAITATKITRTTLTDEAQSFLMHEKHASGLKSNRNLLDLAAASLLKVDMLQEINTLIKERGRVIEVLDSGCGEAVALSELKQRFGSKIRATGITLREEHVELVLGYPVERQPDEMVVGALQNCSFDKEYDFIIDFYGPNFYSRNILPIYGRILASGGKAFVRELLYSASLFMEDYLKLFSENQLRVIGYETCDYGRTDFLLGSTK
jgi:SAM-dependent methyltransferase